MSDTIRLMVETHYYYQSRQQVGDTNIDDSDDNNVGNGQEDDFFSDKYLNVIVEVAVVAVVLDFKVTADESCVKSFEFIIDVASFQYSIPNATCKSW